MSDAKPIDPKAEALARQLKEKLERRRPRPWKLVIASLVIATLLLALLAWWMYPRPKSLPLQVMALDVLATPDETPRARARLIVSLEDKERRRLAGLKVVFHESELLAPKGEQARLIETVSDEHGDAAVDWPLRKLEPTPFQVVHVNRGEEKASPVDVGNIFVWAKDAKLLLVDARETLIAKDLDIKASETLMKAHKDDWKIVYIVPGITVAQEFREARRWILDKPAKLPIGPVLGRERFTNETSVESARRELLKQVQGRFNGRLVAVVRNADSAKVCTDAGLTTIVLGGEAPAGTRLALAWTDVPGHLK
jgi:hypothetical protein